MATTTRDTLLFAAHNKKIAWRSSPPLTMATTTTTTTMSEQDDAAVDTLFQQATHHTEDEGIWIGVDFGTSNSGCAVWDSAGGRSKWIRLSKQLAPPLGNGKNGRNMPSAVLFGSGSSVTDVMGRKESALVGQSAVNVVDESFNASQAFQDVPDAFVMSVKRIFGMNPAQLKQSVKLLEALPFNIVYKKDEHGNEQVYLQIRPLDTHCDVLVSPLQVTAIILKSIREAAQLYLDTDGRKKHLDVPGNGRVCNCVVGVPAHFGHGHRHLMEEACKLAGFQRIYTITESTAASMAYGLFVAGKRQKSILVFDMGGGTTDLTICQMKADSTVCVVVAEGDSRLGGDDMDEALLQLVLKKHEKKTGKQHQEISMQERRYSLRACRKGKEELCGNDDGNAPAESCTILINKEPIEVSWQEFSDAMDPLIQRAQNLVRGALDRYDKANTSIDEVVLVGGATRVPEVRSMLREIFPHVELCTSINADSAVAQGAAIQAALRSGLVPPHELRSALMLDALPHSIGVQLDDGTFLAILEKDSPLPCMGYASFTLADVHQPGVRVVAVENVGDDLPLEQIGEFTFLLRRLSEEQLAQLGNKRSVDIGMTMETDGKFIVSIFDPNDPEHLKKKRRYQKAKAAETGMVLDYHEEAADEVGVTWTREEVRMMVIPILLFVLYVGVKLAFHEPHVDYAR